MRKKMFLENSKTEEFALLATLAVVMYLLDFEIITSWQFIKKNLEYSNTAKFLIGRCQTWHCSEEHVL